MPRPHAALAAALIIVGMTPPDADAQTAYQRPPRSIADALNAPRSPLLSVSPTRDTVALIEVTPYPPIADLALPTLRLAGVRINPRTNGPDRETRVRSLTLQPIAGGTSRRVDLPEDTNPSYPMWSPDGKRFALTLTVANGIELWVGDVATAVVKRIPEVRVNAAVGEPVQWMPDSTRLLVQLVPVGRTPPPEAPPTPPGPTVQESTGKAAPVRTYQDLLKNAHDEELFDHYATTQLARVDVVSHAVERLGAPAVILRADPSPNGRYLLVSRTKRPYSYLYPVSSFPRTIEVWDTAGKVTRTVADLPLADTVPIDGVPTGPRSVQWVAGKPATLLWVEARDRGDPRSKVPYREELFTQSDPFDSSPKSAGRVEHRFAGVSFFETGDVALVRDYDRDRKWGRAILMNLTDPSAERNVVFDRSVQDRYGDPGTPVLKLTPSGHRVMRTTHDGRWLLSSDGATAKGEFPFLDLFDPKSGKSERIFQCRTGVYEYVAATLDDTGRRLLIRRESPTAPGNYFVRENDIESPLTHFSDPYPELRKVTKQLVTTTRADGVTISFTLYLPPGVQDGVKLPTVFWAYPREFASADTAGQVNGSPNRFVTIAGASHLFLLLHGYAVMDEVSIPIVGPPASANDTYVEQLVSSAKAAIDKACTIAPIDRDRIGAGGHSYGAFMVANLMAHSDLFRAGVARSGAYNRTLTPFGFQNERRTFWEAPEVYARMSPFHAAHTIREPILFIHGEADNNAGTFPMQSERMYQAVRGNGGTARLVLLPHESHGYQARESVEHVLSETAAWFDRHVKNAPPR